MDKRRKLEQDPEKAEKLRVSLYNLSKEIERLYDSRTELMPYDEACALAERFNVPKYFLVWFYA